MRKRLLTRLAAAGAGGALALAAVSPALADHDEATAVTTDPDSVVTSTDTDAFPSEGPTCEVGHTAVKIEEAGGWAKVDNGVTIEIQESAEFPKHYTVSISGEVDGEEALLHLIHIAGGPGDPPAPGAGTTYEFDPGVKSASNLTAAEAGKDVADISHAWVCYGPGDEPANGNGEEEDTPPGEEEDTPPGEEEDTPPGEEAEEENGEELPQTGAQLGGMLVLAFGLVAAGAAMMFVRRRRNLADLLES